MATTSAPDAELVCAARRGDKKAFVEIVARHQAMVCGIALGILGDFAASEDVGQEAFLTAWRRIHELREPGRLRSWLGQIARNTALGHRRRVKGHEPIDEGLTLADSAPAPDERVASEEEAALVRDSLAKLPESYRLPLVLFYREGQSVRAVAESLGLGEDAVKQRLARGREMLRDEMSGVIETVLTRTGPTAVFTMTIAAAIGALVAPTVVAGGVFGVTSAVGAASGSTISTTPLLTVMSTTKTSLITAALVAAVCIPVGYQMATTGPLPAPGVESALTDLTVTTFVTNARPSFESSALLAQWRELHEIHGTTPEAMPDIYFAIADIGDPFRRRAFRAALISEWVQLDPANGLMFFLEQQRDATQRRQFFEEWMARDARAAVDALMTSGSTGWQSIARNSLVEIARRVPSRVASIVAQLPASSSYWDTKVRDAFALVAEGGLDSARIAAEGMTGPNREQALAGVAYAWAKRDLDGSVAWVKSLKGPVDGDELIRAALIGRSAINPMSALDQIGLVPPGGRQNYFATTTGARVLSQAVMTDYNATVAWLMANPGRLGHDDMMGMAREVTARMNADVVGFLERHSADGSLGVLLPAINSALLNDASGQRAVIWDWLKQQPENAALKGLKGEVLRSAGYQDPALALRMTGDLPRTPEGDAQVRSLVGGLFNGGSALHRFDRLFDQAPERLRPALIETAFAQLRGETMLDPQPWIARLDQLPESARARGTESIARAWADQRPEEAVEWLRTMPAGETRHGAVAAVTSAWAAKDSQGAAGWVASMSPGAERDQSARSLVLAIAERHPQEAWEWALSIGDNAERQRAAGHAARMMAMRDAATARQSVEAAHIAPEFKAELLNAIQQIRRSTPAR